MALSMEHRKLSYKKGLDYDVSLSKRVKDSEEIIKRKREQLVSSKRRMLDHEAKELVSEEIVADVMRKYCGKSSEIYTDVQILKKIRKFLSSPSVSVSFLVLVEKGFIPILNKLIYGCHNSDILLEVVVCIVNIASDSHELV